MATLGTMRSRIADELKIDATTYAVQIDAAIFSAIEYYNDDDLWFLEASPSPISFTLTTNYNLTTLLPGRSQINKIVLEHAPNSTREPMLYRTMEELVGYSYDDNFTGDPLYYTVFADTLMVRPRPSQTFTAQVWYSLRRSMTASATASSVWTNEAEELIRLHSEVDLLENQINDDEKALRKRARLEQVRTKLDEKTIHRRGSRRIKPSM